MTTILSAEQANETNHSNTQTSAYLRVQTFGLDEEGNVTRRNHHSGRIPVENVDYAVKVAQRVQARYSDRGEETLVQVTRFDVETVTTTNAQPVDFSAAEVSKDDDSELIGGGSLVS